MESAERGGWRRLMRHMRLPLAAFAALALLAASGMFLTRSALLKTALEPGTALSRSCAAGCRAPITGWLWNWAAAPGWWALPWPAWPTS